MKILVTGLCLSRNLGGPAMGLTLAKNLRRRFPEAEMVFAVDPLSFDQEQEWAARYGLDVVRRDNVASVLVRKLPLRRLPEAPWQAIHRELMAAYADCDLVICMQGIAYVGDGVQNPLHGLICYSDYHYARKHRKPFARFIQSFGPFDDWKVRLFARRELDALPFVFARGRASAGFCRELVRDPDKVDDFPDVAVLLDRDDDWARSYLAAAGLEPGGYLVLSPSNVIARIRSGSGSSVGPEHLASLELVARRLLDRGEKILLLPHMYSDRKEECDRELCLELAERLGAGESVAVVREDVDPMQAKGLIAACRLAIVSRYHALVAAASTATPAITIGWNVKYRDLMEYYGVSEMAIDARRHAPAELLAEVERRIERVEASDLAATMNARQGAVEARVGQAFSRLFDWVSRQAPAG